MDVENLFEMGRSLTSNIEQGIISEVFLILVITEINEFGRKLFSIFFTSESKAFFRIPKFCERYDVNYGH